MKVNKDFILKEVLDSNVLINKKNSNYIIKLNKTSTSIFNYVLSGKSTNQIIDLLTKEYSVDKETIYKDVKEFIDEMIDRKVFIDD